MTHPRVYADFHNLDDLGRLRLTCQGTSQDLTRQGIELRDGMRLTFFMDDADDNGRPDDLLADGEVQFDPEAGCWVGAIDWDAIRHDSEGPRARRDRTSA